MCMLCMLVYFAYYASVSILSFNLFSGGSFGFILAVKTSLISVIE